MSTDPAVLDPSAFERLERIGGQRLVERMVETFSGFAQEKVSEIEDACRDQRWQDAGVAAHALKSSAGNIGATTLQRLSFEVEQAGKAQDSAATPSLVLELLEAYGAVQAALARQFPDGEA